MRCWNGGLHHTDIGAKLAVRREDEEEEAEPVEEEAPPSPQPRLYKGRCFLSDGSFAFSDGPCRLRQRGKALLDVSVISDIITKKKEVGCAKAHGDLGTVPLRVVNAKANLEDSRRDGREGSYASSYLAERRGAGPGAGRRGRRYGAGVITKKIGTIGGTAPVVNPNQPGASRRGRRIRVSVIRPVIPGRPVFSGHFPPPRRCGALFARIAGSV